MNYRRDGIDLEIPWHGFEHTHSSDFREGRLAEDILAWIRTLSLSLVFEDCRGDILAMNSDTLIHLSSGRGDWLKYLGMDSNIFFFRGRDWPRDTLAMDSNALIHSFSGSILKILWKNSITVIPLFSWGGVRGRHFDIRGIKNEIFLLKDWTPGKLHRNSYSSLDQQANDSLREQWRYR